LVCWEVPLTIDEEFDEDKTWDDNFELRWDGDGGGGEVLLPFLIRILPLWVTATCIDPSSLFL